MTTIRIGLAGAGAIGRAHLASYLNLPPASVVAVACSRQTLDNLPGKLGQTQRQFDPRAVRHFPDYRDLCAAPDIDMVAICLPTDQHADATIRALESGKHVLCEKPMALTVEQGKRMLAAAAASGRQLMIAHCLRFWPEYLAVEQILREGRFGRALAASLVRCVGNPIRGASNWFSDPRRSGGAVLDLHIHDADAALWWWGKPAAITAGGTYLGDSPNIVHSRWRYADGLAVQFEAAFETVTTAPFYYAFKLTLECATVRFDSRLNKGLEVATARGLETVNVPPGSALESENRYFLEAISAGRSVDRCLPSDSLVALECVTETARQLAATHGKD